MSSQSAKRPVGAFTIGDRVHGVAVVYLYRMIRCGKCDCLRCPHGPYLYQRSMSCKAGVWKLRELYVGKIGSELEKQIFRRKLVQEIQAERGGVLRVSRS